MAGKTWTGKFFEGLKKGGNQAQKIVEEMDRQPKQMPKPKPMKKEK